MEDDIMNLRNLFENETASSKENITGSYSDFIGLNKEFKFVLSKSKVANEAELNNVGTEAEKQLKEDLQRFGQEIFKIDPKFRNILKCKVGSMTIFADDEGNLSVKFHKCNEKGLWDGKTKRHPEKDIECKYKHEIFFVFEEDDD